MRAVDELVNVTTSTPSSSARADQLPGRFGRHRPVGYHAADVRARPRQSDAELVSGDVRLREQDRIARRDVPAQRLGHGRGDGLPRHEVSGDAPIAKARGRGLAYGGDPGVAQCPRVEGLRREPVEDGVDRVHAGEHGPPVPRQVADSVVQLGCVVQWTDLDGGRLDGLGAL